MNIDGIDIDRIVREIVNRLRDEIAVLPTAEFVLDARVVTMEEVRGKLEGVQQLKLRSHAIVTPSVRDELSDRNITLVRAPAE